MLIQKEGHMRVMRDAEALRKKLKNDLITARIAALGCSELTRVCAAMSNDLKTSSRLDRMAADMRMIADSLYEELLSLTDQPEVPADNRASPHAAARR